MMSKEKEVNKSSASNVGYKGTVTIKVVGSSGKVNKKYKGSNSGKLALFEFISYAIGGNFESGLCPSFISLYDESDTNMCERPSLKVSETYKSSEEAESATAELTFIVAGSTLVSGTVKKLRLYNNDNYTTYNDSDKQYVCCAEYDFEGSEDSITVDSDESIIVVWDLTIGNQVSAQQESEEE